MNKSLKKLFATLAVFIFALFSTSNSVSAAPGDLDTSFGNEGKVVTAFNGTTTSRANDIVVQPDGKFVTAGMAGTPGDKVYFALARYNPNGSLDTSFGVGGAVLTEWATSTHASAEALIIQPDGKLVVGGQSDYHFILARYNPDGSLDSSFGVGGKVTTKNLVASGVPGIKDLVIQPDGKIVAAGFSSAEGTLLLVRYNPDGSIDSNFGSGGNIRLGAPFSVPYALTIQPDGKLIAVGSGFNTMRFNVDGSPDLTFGNNGVAANPNFSSSAAWDVLIQPDGKIVAGGGSATYFALVRYNPNGSLDTSFGINGKATTLFDGMRHQLGRALAMQSDGKLILSGRAYDDNQSNFHFVSARYNSNGSLDTSFGNNGAAITDFSGFHDEVLGLVIQADGKLVAAGYTYIDTSSTNFALAQYETGFTNLPPTSNPGPNQTVFEGGPVSFDGSLSTDPDGIEDIVNYEWDFGDGNIGSDININHTYVDDGVYTATLTVTDTAGEFDSDTVVLTVNNSPPVVGNISLVDPVLSGVEINTSAVFTDAGILDTHTATWDWGDTTSTTGIVNEILGFGTVTGSHTYTAPGIYTVTLTVSDEVDSSVQTLVVHILTPSEAIDDLIDTVIDMNLQNGIENSLDAKLDSAQNSLDDINANNDVAAINSLQSLINAVEAQRGNKITNEEADILVAAAQAIIDNLSF